MLRFRFRSTPPDDRDAYQDDLAQWQIAHHADRHDLTPDQGRRLRQHNVLSDAGLDPNRLSAVRWAVDHGRVTDE